MPTQCSELHRPCTQPLEGVAAVGGPSHTIGEALVDCAPQIADIVQNELGASALCSYNSVFPNNFGSCSNNAQWSQAKEISLPQLGDLASQQHELTSFNLGAHPHLGQLWVRLPGAGANCTPTPRVDPNVLLQKLLPKWSRATGYLLGFPGSARPPGRPEGRLTSVREITGGGIGAFQGLFWTDHFFRQAAEFGAATLLAHHEVGLQHEKARLSSTTPSRLEASLTAGQPNWSEILVTDSKITGLPCDRYDHGGETLSIDANGAFEIVRHPPLQIGGSRATLMGNVRDVLLCGRLMSSAALADYQFWWAHRLYHAAMDSGSVWHLVMAVLSARSALAEVLYLSAAILHELGHVHSHRHSWCGIALPSVNSHCSHGCSYYANQWNFVHVMAATYGLPLSYGADNRKAGEATPLTPGYPSPRWATRFSVEPWSLALTGSAGVDECQWQLPESGLEHLVQARYCGLLRQKGQVEVVDYTPTRCLVLGGKCFGPGPVVMGGFVARPRGNRVGRLETTHGTVHVDHLEKFVEVYGGGFGSQCFG